MAANRKYFIVATFVLTLVIFIVFNHQTQTCSKHARLNSTLNSTDPKTLLFDKTDEFYRTLNYTVPSRALRQNAKKFHPPRQNMEECKPIYGRIGILSVVESGNSQKFYKVAQDSLKCYLRSTPYEYFYVNADQDELTKNLCNQTAIVFKRFCIAAYYLKKVDWLLFVDADIGVVNPEHCIEEYIDPRVEMIFYERFFNWEIAMGSVLMKNTAQSHKFLLDLANMESQMFPGFSGLDNGALQILILKAAIPAAVSEIKACDQIYRRSATYDLYLNYLMCVKLQLGAVRVFPGVLRIYRRAHGWVRDNQITDNEWSDFDFMLHNWKKNEQATGDQHSANVFMKVPDPDECGRNLNAWQMLPEKRVLAGKIRQHLSNYEANEAKKFPQALKQMPYLIEPDIGQCYPFCDVYT